MALSFRKEFITKFGEMERKLKDSEGKLELCMEYILGCFESFGLAHTK